MSDHFTTLRSKGSKLPIQRAKIANYTRAYFNHLLRAVPSRSALFERQNDFFSTKTSKNTGRLGGCSVLNALIFQKSRGKKPQTMPFYWSFLPFFGYTARMPLFSRISPLRISLSPAYRCFPKWILETLFSWF